MAINQQKLKAVIIAAEDIIIDSPYIYNSSLPPEVMLINGRDLDPNMHFLQQELSGRIDSNTFIFINAHGNIDEYGRLGYRKGEHIISLNSKLPYSTTKLIKYIEKLEKSPLKFFLDSCYSGDGTKYFMSALKSKSTLVTNAKEGHSSITSFSIFDHNYIINSLNKVSNPYEDFISLFDVKAMEYAKFITQTEVFKTNPDYKILTSPELARKFLEQEIERFVEFAENKQWNNNKLTLSSREFSDSEILNFSGNLFHHLCGLGERKFIKFLTENIENNIYLKSYVNHTPSIDQPINVASIGGNIEIVKLLLLHGADINNKEIHLNSTPIISALFNGHIKLAEFLLKQNANVNITRTDGVSALQVASKNGLLKLVKIILSKNAQINQANNEGITAIHKAILNKQDEVVNFLLENKASINTAHYTGITPLCSASEKGSANIIQLLLNHNANINMICDQGDSPLIKAIISDSFDAVKMLVENGACINFYTDNGFSPILYSLFKNKNFKITKFLIKNGADTSLTSPIEIPVINMLKADIKYNELVEYISSVSSDISNHEDPSCKVNYEITFSGETIQSEININHINEQ